MALLEDAISEIADPRLRERIAEQVRKLKNEKRFGLVFEEHIPEVVPLHAGVIQVGNRVALKTRPMNVIYRVTAVNGTAIHCVKDGDPHSPEYVIDQNELVVIKRFGEAIYPTLVPVERIDRAPGKPCHVLLEADNYHALQLFNYVYAGRVDCIYIDPPYNTGARDWKYNNDYVDLNDQWRHSKWLSFMQKRLKLAKNLLNPENGVLIVTIDEHEVNHLGMLLEQTFPEAYIQLVTIVVNPKGVTQGRFSRVEEYAYFCFMRGAFVRGRGDDLLTPGQEKTPPVVTPRWKGLLRSGTNARRKDRPNLFFPVLVDPVRRAVLGVGEPLPFDVPPDFDTPINGLVPVWPVRSDGSLGNWGVGHKTLLQLIEKGYVALGAYDRNRRTYGITYLSKKPQKQIETGAIQITNYDTTRNVVTVSYVETAERQVKAVWHRTLHDAGAYGSDLLGAIFGQGRVFPFPKSLYAVRDALSAVVRDRPQAIIVDFFAGSGTTLHATALLNQEDGGSRQCVLVTNNEVAAEDATRLQDEGAQPGDPRWEGRGICRSVTFPRCKYVITGRREDGAAIPGTYLTGNKVQRDIPRLVRPLGFTSPDMLVDVKAQRQLAAALGLVQSKVNAGDAWYLEEEDPVSILFSPDQLERYCEALGEEGDHVTTIYLPYPDGKAFGLAKQQVLDVLPPLLKYEDETKPFAAGFGENLAYFRLDFLDPMRVELGHELSRILPILWMLSGAIGQVPHVTGHEDYIFPTGCPFAVLLNETAFPKFKAELTPLLESKLRLSDRHLVEAHEMAASAKGTSLDLRNVNSVVTSGREITHVFLVTDSVEAFATMKMNIPGRPKVIQLYRNYLDNFRINTEEGWA